MEYLDLSNTAAKTNWKNRLDSSIHQVSTVIWMENCALLASYTTQYIHFAAIYFSCRGSPWISDPVL